MTGLDCDPVGRVETPFESRADAPRQGQWDDAAGVLHVDPAYEAGLDGVEAGQDLLVVWFADDGDRSLLFAERRGRGVFATRSPDRPCPIGITRCTVEAVDGTELRLRGVDMLDGSPVLDLKPPLD